MKGKLNEGDPPGGGRVAVVGLGNVLMGDDGFGPFVVQHLLARYDFPDWVTVTDLGTPGLDLIPFIDGAAILVVVDTIMLRNDSPGVLRVFRGEELRAVPRTDRLSPHDPGLLETLDMLALRGGGPNDVLLIGVVPESCAVGPGLSGALRNAVEQAIAAVVDNLSGLGVRVSRREQPLPPDIWWEKPVATRERQP